MLDPSSLAPGAYNTSVTIASNAANGNLTVPVTLQVVPKGAPLIYFQGVQDNATYMPGDTVTPGDIMVVKGEQFSFSPLTLGQAPPLATQVGGASVLVNGQAAPMFYSIYGQLAFLMPMETTLGTALVQVQRDGLTSNTVSVNVGGRAPSILPSAVAAIMALSRFRTTPGPCRWGPTRASRRVPRRWATT